MAQLISLQVYQINSLDPIPVGLTPKIGFAFAGIMVRAINANPGTTGVALSNGIVVYTQVQVMATGAQYSVRESVATIVAAS